MPYDWIGRELGEYVVFERVGSGSMADVYKALQPSMDRLVALKVITPSLSDDPHFVARFRREAKIAASLEHPHILPVINFGEQNGILYLVMRYVNGGTLYDVIRQGPMPPPVVLRYLTEIGEALDYAHGLRVVHRDIKPKNVLLDSQGNPFISDFGLAKMSDIAAVTGSGVGGMIGTPYYMSPEQARGQMTVDGRSDLYGLGVMVYEMLTGRVPFDADSAVGIVMKHIGETPPNITQANPRLPPALNEVIQRALAKTPNERYQTAHDFTSALASALGATTLAAPFVKAVDLGARSTLRGRTISASALDQGERVLRRLKRRVQTNRFLRSLGARLMAWFPALNQLTTNPAWIGGGVSVLAVSGLCLTAIWLSTVLGVGPAIPLPTTAPTAVVLQTATNPSPLTSPSPVPSSTVAASPTGVASTPAPSSSPAPTPLLPEATRVIANKDAMELVYIPAGNFLLGSPDTDPEAREDEKPQQTIYLDAFWMDRTEVTVAQFTDFVRATNYQTDAERGCCEGDYAEVGGVVFTPANKFVSSATWLLPEGSGVQGALPRRPVVQVSWNDAATYCEWAGRRLPTEAEWDKAARGTEGWVFPWGDEFDGRRLNYCDAGCSADWRDPQVDDTFPRTSNVGVFPAGASGYGIADLSGNAREWVNDFYDFRGYYRYPLTNPTGPENGLTHVLRGGSWLDSFDRVRASAREPAVPDARDNLTGFRCAADAEAFP